MTETALRIFVGWFGVSMLLCAVGFATVDVERINRPLRCIAGAWVGLGAVAVAVLAVSFAFGLVGHP